MAASPLRCGTRHRGAQEREKVATRCTRWSCARKPERALGECGEWHCWEAQTTANCSPLSSYPTFSMEQESHLPYTPWDWLRQHSSCETGILGPTGLSSRTRSNQQDSIHQLVSWAVPHNGDLTLKLASDSSQAPLLPKTQTDIPT